MKKIQSIRFKQIVIFSITLVIFSLFSSMAVGTVSRKRLGEELENTLTISADLLAMGYGNWIDKELSLLSSFSNHLILDYDDPLLYTLCIEEAKFLGYQNLKPVDLSKTLHLSVDTQVDLSSREYLQTLFKEQRAIVSDPIFSVLEGEEDLLTIVMAVPIFREDELVGALLGQRTADFLTENLSFAENDENTSKFVLNSKGTHIANTNYKLVQEVYNPIDMSKEIPELAELASITEKMIDGQRGLGSYTSIAGEKQILAFSPIPGTNWSAAITEAGDDVYAAIAEMTMVFLSLSIFSLIGGVIIAVILGNALTKPIIILNKAMDEISSGDADLTKKIQLNRKDELESLAQGFNQFLHKLHSIILSLKGSQSSLETVGSDLSSTSLETASAINQIMVNIEGVRKHSQIQAENTGEAASASLVVSREISALDKLIDEQVDSSTEASSVVEEMIANISEVGDSVGKMAQNSKGLIDSMEESRTKQEAMDTRVTEISSQSELLLEANQVISGIAAQTNLLAMNAAIEAAHAGESGRGFSVVADEIRKLAETSAEQSYRISDELGHIQDTIKEVVDVSKSSQAAFSQLSTGIENMEGLVRQIDQAMQEQGEGSKQVLNVLNSLNQLGHQVKEKAVEINSSTQKAAISMDSLIQSSALIEGSMDEMAAGAQEINKAANSVADLASATNENIGDMEDQIGKFII